MADNRIVIGNGLNKNKEETELNTHDKHNAPDISNAPDTSNTSNASDIPKSANTAEVPGTSIKYNNSDGNLQTDPYIEQLPDLEPAPEPLYESLWGNDNIVLSRLDENLLADRRFYARAKYMQKIECSSIIYGLDSQIILLKEPITFMTIDISMGGIGIICEHEIEVGTVLVFKILLDGIIYEVKYEVVYCFQNEDKFRAGLKIAEKDKHFIKHLKILVARLTLQSRYGNRVNQLSGVS